MVSMVGRSEVRVDQDVYLNGLIRAGSCVRYLALLALLGI